MQERRRRKPQLTGEDAGTPDGGSSNEQVTGEDERRDSRSGGQHTADAQQPLLVCTLQEEKLCVCAK
ncbi:putative two-component response regulator [Sesbania bispinosa]|nr:putative two-component response regulator [Sesbania bispinosa]